jgi:ribokinase
MTANCEKTAYPPLIFGIGQCSLDYLGRIDDYPPADTKCEFSGLVIQGGGPVATALVALSRWGLSCAIAGVIGDDAFGRMIETSLRDEGIDTSSLVVRPNGTSQFAYIVVEPKAGRRTIFWQRPTGTPLKPYEISEDKIRTATILHTDGLLIEASLHACRIAHQAGIPVIVDAGTLREGMLDLASLSDYFIASETFARQFWKNGSPLDACAMLLEHGPSLAAVTLGAAGYVARYGNTVISKPAYPVASVDTTGCGDVFHAGFIFGLVSGWDYEMCLDFAAWAAAQVSLQMGGRKGIPTLSEIESQGYPRNRC